MSMKRLQEAAKKRKEEEAKAASSGLATPPTQPATNSPPANGDTKPEKKVKKKKKDDGEKKKKKKKKTADGDEKKKKKKKKAEDGGKKKGTKRTKKPKGTSKIEEPKTDDKPVGAKPPAQEEEVDEGKRLYKEVCNNNEKGVASLLSKGVPPGILNALHPHEATKVAVTAFHVACEKKNWKIVDALANAKADVNARDSEDNSALLWAVKNGAEKKLVEKLIEKCDGDIFLANKAGQTVLFYADGEVLHYLCGVLKGLFPTLNNLLSGEDEIGKRYAVATAYSSSLKNQRNALEGIPDEFWEKLIHLIRFDPSGKSPSSPVELLLPVLITIYNFSVEQKYATAIAKQGGGGATFAFLFGLMCKHSSPTVQSYAGDALFSLSRFDANKDVLAAKWFPILVKLLSNPNPLLQKKSCRIMAEVSIAHEKGKEKLEKEIGAGRLVGLLKAQPHLTSEVCRMLANITQGGNDFRVEVLGEGGFAPLVHAAVVAAEQDTAIASLTAISNLLEAVGDSKYKDDVIGALSRENLFENLSEAAAQGGALEEEVQRVVTLLAANDALKKATQQNKVAVMALKKLAASENDKIQKAALALLGQ